MNATWISGSKQMSHNSNSTVITIASPTGSSQLPVVELKKGRIRKHGLRIRSKTKYTDSTYGDFVQQLPVNAWPFFHAAIKTELTTDASIATVKRWSILFAEQHKSLFKWDPANLRRIKRSKLAYEDFSEAGKAGRFAEATAYLLMHSWGYCYFDRIASLCDRVASKQKMPQKDYIRITSLLRKALGTKTPGLQPDFMFQKKKLADIALAESKGSFVNPSLDNPTVKADLKYGLKQLQTWSKFLKPVVKKTFAIGTYFRDEGDNGDPSVIAYVDPPGADDPNVPSFEIPDDWIRRGNYGNWLMGMGRDEAGNAIRSGEVAELQPTSFLKVKFGGREIAIVPFGIALADDRPTPDRLCCLFSDLFGGFDSRNFPVEEIPILAGHLVGLRTGIRLMALGIDSTTLRILEAVVSRSNLKIDQLPSIDSFDEDGADGVYGSLLSDGSFFGAVNMAALSNAGIEEFRI
jgi:hypothetical protein